MDTVNSKIADAVKGAGDQVVFVNWDRYFTHYRVRYCERNVPEPDGSRLGLLFYEWDTIDNGEPEASDPSTELKRSGTSIGEGTFGGDIHGFVEQIVNAHPDWTYAMPDKATVIRPAPISAIDSTGGSCRVGKAELVKHCTGDMKDQLGVV